MRLNNFKRILTVSHGWRRTLVWIAITLTGVGLILGGFLGAKTLLATRKIIHKDSTSGAPALSSELDLAKLRGEGDGRINILLLGMGGAGHEGPNLTDTIMVVSIDPRRKDAIMLSIPRDLYVSIPGFGKAKINAVYAYGEERKKGQGPINIKNTVSNLLDLPIHYYLAVDFAGFRKAIDTVGGIDINVEKALNDPYFPAERGSGYEPFIIKPGMIHMDGKLALKYARTRHTTSDFDRAKRQQDLLAALRAKALTKSTLINPSKIASLIDIFGDHIHTDMDIAEIMKMASIAKAISASRLETRVLDNSSTGLLVDARVNGAYVLLPKTGNLNEIREFVHSIFIDGYIKEEAASIVLVNATARSGAAISVAKMLSAYNYNILVTLLADRPQPKTTIYDYAGDNPITIKYLESRFNTKSVRLSRPAGEADIKITLGNEYKN